MTWEDELSNIETKLRIQMDPLLHNSVQVELRLLLLGTCVV